MIGGLFAESVSQKRSLNQTWIDFNDRIAGRDHGASIIGSGRNFGQGAAHSAHGAGSHQRREARQALWSSDVIAWHSRVAIWQLSLTIT
jgi:hypothetical protein